MGAGRQETYTLGHGEWSRRWMGARTAASHAGYLLPHLRPGLRLLDCGSGFGTITVDLAEAVAPGETIGIDLEPNQVEAGRRLAAERGVANARFEAGDVYAIPYPAATFDVVFAHAVLSHLKDPPAALREMRRVLKPGRIVAVCDPDLGSALWEPATPDLTAFWDLAMRVHARNGGTPFVGRHLRRLLTEGGFATVEATAFAEPFGVGAATRRWASVMDNWSRAPAFEQTAIAEGWADADRLDTLRAAAHAWAERPDAYFVWTYCAALGRRDG